MRGRLLATRPPRSLSSNFISLPPAFVLTNFLRPSAARYQEIPISISPHLHPLSATTSLLPFLCSPPSSPSLLFSSPLFLLVLLLLVLLFSRAPSDLLAFSSCFFQSQTLVVLTPGNVCSTLRGYILFMFSSVVLRQ